MSIYDSLNKQQQEACFHTEGPVLILAGAGSGKTRVITHRIAYLLDECQVNPWNILAITFTNKAAGEMRERVDKLVGFGAESIWISTFHSMCVRILRRTVGVEGYTDDFTIYDTDDSRTLMKQVLRDLRIDPKQLRERTVLARISAAKNELKTPDDFRRENHYTFEDSQVADAYEAYQRALRKNNALDFDDLLMKTVQLFNARPDVLAAWQDRFRYICVDEYQDTNTAQFELVRQLAAKSRNLCVVGDDDQSIYKFRGANIRNILDFEETYPDAFVVKLEQNYRSTQNVLDAANAVIRNNRERKAKALWTGRGEGSPVHFHQFANAIGEAEFIADDIARKKRGNPSLHYKDCAVLYRTNAQARVLEERFVMDSIPYNVVGGTNFYARREIKDLLGYLKTIDNGDDDLAAERIINVPKRGIGQVTIGKITSYAAEKDISFFRALGQADAIPGLSASVKQKLAPFTKLIEDLRESLKDSQGIETALSDLLKLVIEKTDYYNYLKETDEEDADDRIANVDELLSKVVDYEENTTEEEPTLAGFLSDVALVADIDDVGEDDDRVLLMTLHSAKGLEFSQVYIAGMEDGIFPGSMTIDSGSEEDMEEERRLAYVGITRAKDDLTLTCARSRMTRGEMHYNPVSRFVYEIPEKLLDNVPTARGRGFLDDVEDGDYGDGTNGSGGRYGDRNKGSYGGSYGNSGFGGRTFVTYAGKTSEKSDRAANRSTEIPGSSGARSGIGGGQSKLPPRPKAVLRPKGTDASHKPYIAAANDRYKSLGGLSKGMPAAPEKPDYVVGDRVLHVKFGAGTVKALEATPRDYKVTVDFDEYGTKIMYAAFAKLQKA